MKTLTTAEKIDYLWHSDTPLTTSLAGVLQHHLGCEPPCENATPNSPSDNDFVRALSKHSQKRQKLEALPPAEIDLLFALARNAELRKTELQRPYNQPLAQADFPHWAKVPRWTVDETVALLLGKNPGIVKERYLEKFKYDDELAELERESLKIMSLAATVKRGFSRQYKELVALVERSEIFLPGTQDVDPVSALHWARHTGISIPAALAAALAGKNARAVTWITPAPQSSVGIPAASSKTASEPQAARVVIETVAQRRARYLAMYETEEKREKRGALQRIADIEGVDRSNMSKDIGKARAARDEQKQAGTWISQLVQDGKRKR